MDRSRSTTYRIGPGCIEQMHDSHAYILRSAHHVPGDVSGSALPAHVCCLTLVKTGGEELGLDLILHLIYCNCQPLATCVSVTRGYCPSPETSKRYIGTTNNYKAKNSGVGPKQIILISRTL